MRPTSCISSKWLKNSMQFTLGMPFLAVLGKFYRNLKGLNSVSYRRVQHISYICVFLTHTICFLPREKEPQDLPCYSKERGPIQMFPISKSAQSIYAGLGHTLHLHLVIDTATVSVARTPLFEIRGVRFTHKSPYWLTSVTPTCLYR